MGVGLLSSMFDGSSEEDRLSARWATTTMTTTTATARAPQVVRLSAAAAAPTQSSEMSQQQKIAAAMMRAGITSPAAWAAAGLENSAVAVSDKSVGGSFEQRPPVVLTKGTNNKTFLISWRSQREVAKALGWKCALMIWGGAAIAVASLYVLLGVWHIG